MKTLSEIEKILTTKKEYLTDKYKISAIGIFGSYVREQQDKNSDLDILIDSKEKISFQEILDLEEELSKLCNIKVDLVLKRGLKKYIGQHILKEAKFL